MAIRAYRFLRPLLFRLPAETSHHFSFTSLRLLHRLPGFGALLRARCARRTPALPVKVLGLDFPNPVGLAAGLDKNAEYFRALADFGFGFIELGTVTPRPQPGNPEPRLFRLPEQAALINRMGFNNVGIDRFLVNLGARKPCPIGINLGKNRDTPADQAIDDYLAGLRAAYACADYLTVNISSPNTPGLRDLQRQENLEALLPALKAEQTVLHERLGRYTPIALKIAPDLADAELAAVARLVLEHRFDAVIATNTTISRPPSLARDPTARQSGGLSGRPLKALSTDVIRKLYGELQGHVPIIGVGGIENGQDAWDKLVAGADLVQVYTALIYHGPGLIADIVRDLARRVTASGQETLTAAVAEVRRRKN